MEIPFAWRFSDRCTGTGPVKPVSAMREPIQIGRAITGLKRRLCCVLENQT